MTRMTPSTADAVVERAAPATAVAAPDRLLDDRPDRQRASAAGRAGRERERNHLGARAVGGEHPQPGGGDRAALRDRDRPGINDAERGLDGCPSLDRDRVELDAGDPAG